MINAATVREGLPFPPSSVEDVKVLPGVETACAEFRAAGLRVVVVTNQPDVVRGSTSLQAVEAINTALCARVPFDDVVVCFHDDSDACECRKPAPGLLVQAAERWSIDLARSVMVGDRWKDVEAGRRAGCATVFVDHGYQERRPVGQDLTVSSLLDAVPWILQRCRAGR